MPDHQQPALPVEHPEIEGQTSMDDYLCTRDEGCKADVTEHAEDCPVEQRLKEEFGW